MKQAHATLLGLITLFALLCIAPIIANAQSTVAQGGTGLNNVPAGSILFGNTATKLGTSTALQWNNTLSKLSFTNGSSTAFTVPNLYLTGISDKILLTDVNGQVGAWGGFDCAPSFVYAIDANGTQHCAQDSTASSTLLIDRNTWTGLQNFSGGASSSAATIAGNLWLTSLTNSLLSTDQNGKVVATTSIGTNYITGVLGTINTTPFSRGASIVITAASSTLLADANTWTKLQIFSNATTTSLTVTGTASTSKLFADGLVTCNTGNFLTWAAGTFGCAADQTGSGGSAWPFTPSSYAGVANQSTTTPFWLNGTQLIASSTLAVNATTTGSHYFPGGGLWNSTGVAIGTTTQSAVLDVNSPGAAGTIRLEGNSTSVASTFTMNDWTTAGNQFTGLLNPSGTSGANATTLPLAAVFFSGTGSSNGLVFISRGATAPTRFYTGGPALATNFRMVIDATGNVGIATTTPTNRFEVSGNSFFGGNVIATGTLTLSPLATAAGSFLAVDPTGKVIATTTPTAGGSSLWPFTPSTFAGVANQSTTTPLWLKNTGLIASSTLSDNASSTLSSVASTLWVGPGGAGDSAVVAGPPGYEWTFGFDDTDDSFAISSSTVLGTSNALTISKNLLVTIPKASSTIASAGTYCLNTCITSWPTGGSSAWPFTPSTFAGVANQSTTTPFWLNGTQLIASSTLAVNATTTGSQYFTAITSALLSTDSTGKLVATTSIGADKITGILPVANGGTGTTSLVTSQFLYYDGTRITNTAALGGSLSFDGLFLSLLPFSGMRLGSANDLLLRGSAANFYININTSLLSADRMVKFPDLAGTVCIKDGNCTSTSTANTWTALQTFTNSSTTIASANTFCLNTCITSWPAGSTSAWPFTPSSYAGVANQSTTTPFWLNGTQLIASSTLAVNATTTGSQYFTAITSALLSTDSTGKLVATTSIGTNLLTGTLATINTTPITAGGSFTITAASSTALTDANTWTKLQNFTSATSTGLTASNFWITGQAAGCAQFDSNAKLTSTGANCGSGSGGGYPFALTGNATSTLTQFNGGLTAYGTSTIGNGTQGGGLTISGGATTTGSAFISGGLVINGTAGAPVAGKIYSGVTPNTTNYIVYGDGTNSWINSPTTNSYIAFGAADNWGAAITGSGYSGGLSLRLSSTMPFGWTSSNPASSLDTALSRLSAGVVAFGTGANGSTAGGLIAASSTFVSTITLAPLGTPAGSFLAVDPAGKVIATTTPTSGGGGSSIWPFTPSSYAGVANQSTTTPFWLNGTQLIASSTLAVNATTTGSQYFSSITNSLLATDNTGKLIASSSIGTNLLTGTLATINTTPITAGGSFTITAASSTLLANSNTWSGLNSFANASTTLETATTAWIGTLNLTNALGIVSGGTGLNATGASSTVLTTNGTTNAWQKLNLGAAVYGTLPIANGGTNATSFTTSNNAVYYTGSALATAPTTQAVTTPYASSTSITASGTSFFTYASTTAISAVSTSTFTNGLILGTAASLFDGSGTTTLRNTNGLDYGNGTHGFRFIPAATSTFQFY